MNDEIYPNYWYVHMKTLKAYLVIAVAKLESDPEQLMVVYEGHDKTTWARPVEEFMEKFDLL